MIENGKNKKNIILMIAVCMITCIALVVMPSISVTYSNAKYTSSTQSTSAASVANMIFKTSTPHDDIIFEETPAELAEQGLYTYGAYKLLVTNCDYTIVTNSNTTYKAELAKDGKISETSFWISLTIKVPANVTVDKLYVAGERFAFNTDSASIDGVKDTAETDVNYDYYTFSDESFDAMRLSCDSANIRYFVIEMYSTTPTTDTGVKNTSLTVTATQID